MRKPFIFLIVLGFLFGLAWYFKPFFIQQFFKPRQTGMQTGLTMHSEGDSAESVEIVAENLDIPWEIAFLPDGSLLVTQRSGSLVRLWPDSRQSVPVTGVAHVGEGGLLGMALDPDYDDNQLIYLYSTARENGQLINRVERYHFDETTNTLLERTVILTGIAGSANHDGGRMTFGPDGLLYITTGDAEDPDTAQDTNSLNGKILRLNADGSVPADNPFGNAVYSYGHRNPQGLAWDSAGRLWETEHGPSGAQTGNDEVNLIVKGGNYGWPIIRGTQTRAGMIAPVWESGREDTWAPAAAVIVGDTLFFTGLRGQTLYSAAINGSTLTAFKANLAGQYGRLRALQVSPDGQWLYITTSNTDGRGTPARNDDRIVRVPVHLLLEK